MRHRALAVLMVWVASAGSTHQDRVSAQSPDDAVLERLRREGLERSQALALFDHLVTAIGPRLTGTPEHEAAARWSRDRLAAWGLADARLERFEFGRGWQLERQVLEMTAPRYLPLAGHAEAWSASTHGDVVGTPILLAGRSAAEIAAMRDRLAGAIVMLHPIVTEFVRADRLQPTEHDEPVPTGVPRSASPSAAAPQSQAEARQIVQTLREARVGAVLRTSRGAHGTMFVLGRDQGEHALPSVVLSAEHYNMLARMIERGLPVTVRVHLRTRFLTDDTTSANVLAELPGTDPSLRDEIVMVGAHLDSWHSAPGATDNADGAAAVLEAMRILKAAGVRPRRTIRAALWGGEEQGLLGAAAYVRRHLAGEANRAARERLAVYLNIDPGTGPIYGWYLENTPGARPLFDRWIAPLRGLGVRRNVISALGSTDHVAFRRAGIPAFNPIQDYVDYDVRTHHTNVDTYERVREADLKQCAIVMAWTAYQAATADERLPAPAEPTR